MNPLVFVIYILFEVVFWPSHSPYTCFGFQTLMVNVDPVAGVEENEQNYQKALSNFCVYLEVSGATVVALYQESTYAFCCVFSNLNIHRRTSISIPQLYTTCSGMCSRPMSPIVDWLNWLLDIYTCKCMHIYLCCVSTTMVSRNTKRHWKQTTKSKSSGTKTTTLTENGSLRTSSAKKETFELWRFVLISVSYSFSLDLFWKAFFLPLSFYLFGYPRVVELIIPKFHLAYLYYATTSTALNFTSKLTFWYFAYLSLVSITHIALR